MTDLDKLFGPKLVYEPAGLEEPTLKCMRCSGPATLRLDKLILQLRTSEGALQYVESKPDHNVVIGVCTEHKDEDLDEYIADGCHIAIMQQTNVISDLEAYTLYWQDL